jgi:hypothetical protein
MGNKSLNVNRDEFVASIWPEVDYSLFDRIECSEEWGENVDRLDSMFKKSLNGELKARFGKGIRAVFNRYHGCGGCPCSPGYAIAIKDEETRRAFNEWRLSNDVVRDYWHRTNRSSYYISDLFASFKPRELKEGETVGDLGIDDFELTISRRSGKVVLNKQGREEFVSDSSGYSKVPVLDLRTA